MIGKKPRKELLPEMSSLEHRSQNWCPLEIYQPMLPTTNITISHITSSIKVYILLKNTKRNENKWCLTEHYWIRTLCSHSN